MKDLIQRLVNDINLNIDMNMQIYGKTNENLNDIFKSYNFKDKEVLTVLASSDQYFSFLYANAKSVETFDKAYTTLYYYYLRYWLIKYKYEIYPSYKFFFDKDYNLLSFIKNIKTSNKNEEEAKMFWLTYLQNIYDNNYYNFLFNSLSIYPTNPYDNDYTKIYNLISKDIIFYNIDLFNEITINKKYDILYLSNMIDYIDNDIEKLKIFRNNVENLLNKDGIAICSYLINEDISKKKEKEIMQSNNLVFKENNATSYDALIGRKRKLSYYYKLKKN